MVYLIALAVQSAEMPPKSFVVSNKYNEEELFQVKMGI